MPGSIPGTDGSSLYSFESRHSTENLLIRCYTLNECEDAKMTMFSNFKQFSLESKIGQTSYLSCLSLKSSEPAETLAQN